MLGKMAAWSRQGSCLEVISALPLQMCFSADWADNFFFDKMRESEKKPWFWDLKMPALSIFERLLFKEHETPCCARSAVVLACNGKSDFLICCKCRKGLIQPCKLKQKEKRKIAREKSPLLPLKAFGNSSRKFFVWYWSENQAENCYCNNDNSKISLL